MNFSILSPDLLDPAYLTRLIVGKIPESLFLDYKRDLNIETHAEKKEFLADISSFANAEGGVIIFGIEEERTETPINSGIPGQIVGIPNERIDSVTLAIEDLNKNCIEPGSKHRI